MLITLKADGFNIELDNRGNVTSLTYGGDNIPTEKAPFVYLLATLEDRKAPESVTEKNGVLTFEFGICSLDISYKSCGEYLELALLTEIPDSLYGIDFGCIEISGFSPDGDLPALFSYALTENVDEKMYPDAYNGKSFGRAMRRFNTLGGRLAIVLCERDEICPILKKIHSTLSPDDRAVLPIAGPYAREYEKNHGNYVIISQTSPEYLDSYIKFYNEAGVTQLDFHQGPNSFRQGDFYFHKYGGSAKRFKEEFAKPLSDAGILSGLHTYAYYIDASSPLLADERWQEQLCYLDDEYTLDEDLVPDQPFIKTLEDTSTFSTNHTFFSDSLPHVLIDNEILMVRPEKGGFAITGRGMAQTPHTTHKKGAKIRHFFGRFCMFTPKPGSELFFKIARDTAKAYNEGGFEMIYLDALDGIGHHCPRDEAWYWAGRFVSEIVKNCDTPPIIEYSTMYPSLWPCRGRMGAWDTPYRGFKDFVDVHVKANLEWESRHYTTTLGWYLAYPVSAQKYPANYTMRYQFDEDIDYVGTEAFCHGSSMVFINLNRDNFEKYPAFKRNVTNYRRYSEAMSDKSLTDLREKLLANPYEKRLLDGCFVEKSYKKSKLYSSGDSALFDNPFKAQKPFIRLEAGLSTKGEDSVTLVKFDESAPVSEGGHNFDYVDMDNRLALRVRVKGNGKNSAVVLRLASSWNNGKGVADYTIFTDFTGWREIILAEVDNGFFPEFKAPVPRDFGSYSYYRSNVNYDHVDRLEVYTVGNVDGVSIGDVIACAHESFTADRISIGKSLCINTPVESGEYVELYPDGKALKFDSFGNSEEVVLEGELPTLERGCGKIEVTTSSDIISRFTVTVGFTGEIIK